MGPSLGEFVLLLLIFVGILTLIIYFLLYKFYINKMEDTPTQWFLLSPGGKIIMFFASLFLTVIVYVIIAIASEIPYYLNSR